MVTPFKDGDYFILVKKEWLTDKSVPKPFWLGVMDHKGFTDDVKETAFCKMLTNFEHAAMNAYGLVRVRVTLTTQITFHEE